MPIEARKWVSYYKVVGCWRVTARRGVREHVILHFRFQRGGVLRRFLLKDEVGKSSTPKAAANGSLWGVSIVTTTSNDGEIEF